MDIEIFTHHKNKSFLDRCDVRSSVIVSSSVGPSAGASAMQVRVWASAGVIEEACECKCGGDQVRVRAQNVQAGRTLSLWGPRLVSRRANPSIIKREGEGVNNSTLK